MREVEIRPGLLVREDGLVRNITGHFNAKADWNAGELHPKGYFSVTIPRVFPCRKEKVHRLVAEAFIQNPEGLPRVNHINNTRGDNRVENLEWVTHREDNSRKSTHNAGRIVGVRYMAKCIYNPWIAKAKYKKKTIHIGCYKTQEEASNAYWTWRNALPRLDR